MRELKVNMSTNFDMLRVLRTLWEGKWPILGGCLAGGILALVLSTSLTRKYQAQGSVVVRSAAMMAQDNDAAFSAVAVNDAVVLTEQEVLSSRGLIERVAAQVNIPPALLERNSLGQQVIALIGKAVGVISLRLRDDMEAGAIDLFPVPPSDEAAVTERRVQLVASALSVSANKGSSVISVKAVTPDAELSTDIVNRTLQAFMDDRIAEQTRTGKLIEAALRERLRQTRLQIAEREDRLTHLLQSPGASDDVEVPGAAREIPLLSAQLASAQAELAHRESVLNSTRQSRDGAGEPVTELRMQLAQLQKRMASISASYGSNYPARVALEREIATMRAEIAAENNRGIEQRRADVAAARATVASLQSRIDALRQNRRSQSASTIGLAREREAVSSLWRISESLENRLIDLAAHPANANARVLTLATVPVEPAFPSKTLFATAGLVLGGSLGALAMLIRAHVRRLRPDAVDLAERLNIPLLGGLPQLSRLRFRQQPLLVSSGLGSESRNGLAETLHAVALEVEEKVKSDQIRCLMVTSGRSGEGKTTVAVALGRVLSAFGLRVLLIDLDLRHPSAERIFLLSAPGSLVDEILRVGPDGQVLKVRADRRSSLHFLTPDDPASKPPISYLRSDALRETVAIAREHYDLVLFDTPPTMAAPDALLISALADSILLVIELGRSSDAETDEVSRRLARTGKPICGAVVTKVTGSNIRSGTYGGYPGSHYPGAASVLPEPY
jgi:capsular exopolysaccharide synthesis family protein